MTRDRSGTTARCPTCGSPRDPTHRPFCSRRCRDVDLHRWLTGSYRIPVIEDEDDGLDQEDGQDSASRG